MVGLAVEVPEYAVGDLAVQGLLLPVVVLGHAELRGVTVNRLFRGVLEAC